VIEEVIRGGFKGNLPNIYRQREGREVQHAPKIC